MASPGNPNAPCGGPFDMQKLFKPSAPPLPPSASVPNSNYNPQNFVTTNVSNTFTNPNLASAPFPPPSASYHPTSGGAYAFPAQTAPFHYHHAYPDYSNHPQAHQDFVDVAHLERTLSYPKAPPELQSQAPTAPHGPNFSSSAHHQNPNNHGARLMALLSAPPTLEISQQQTSIAMPQIQSTSSAGSDLSTPHNLPAGSGPVIRKLSSKLPKGRHLTEDQFFYDIDVRYPGEMQPLLDVTPITKYASDPGLVVGRQIAVNKTYICYGLKLGAIRVLNINTALRSLLKGLGQRVTDMVFFDEDVPLLASASADGRVYVWTITEGPDEEGKPQITGRINIAIQITGGGESVHPRVCWHCYKQEVLLVGIGRHVLKIDTTKVGKSEKFSVEEPLSCPIEKLIDGVQFVGSHDREVSDLSMCQWMTTRSVSASVDGTIKIWEDQKSHPVAVLRPHDGLPVSSVMFLAAPHRSDHIILITGGPFNREVKIWVSASEDGWLLPSDTESWHCTQTLELKSSKARAEEAFFNQVLALPQAGLLLLANAKRNAIYVVHLDYGPNPNSTHMDYISEFTVTMPILSFTGTSKLLSHGDQIVQVYCVQTQAIQQYALDLSQCLPPLENILYEKSNASVSLDAATALDVKPSSGKSTEFSSSSFAPKVSITEKGLVAASTVRYPFIHVPAESPTPQEFTSAAETKLVPMPDVANYSVSSAASPPVPLSPRLSKTFSGVGSQLSSHGLSASDRHSDPKIVEYSVERPIDGHANLSDIASFNGDSRISDNELFEEESVAANQPIKFKRPTHLVTPAEILMANSVSEPSHTIDSRSDGELNIQDVVVSNDTRNVEVDVKIVNEMRFSQSNNVGHSQDLKIENKERYFYSQASEGTQERHVLSPGTFTVGEDRQFDATGESEIIAQFTAVEVHDSVKDASSLGTDLLTVLPVQQHSSTSGKGKKRKGKSGQGSGPSLAESAQPSTFNLTDSTTEHVDLSSPVENAFPEIYSMQKMLIQLVSLQKEMQKQMAAMISAPVNKEGKRLEASLGRSMEKAVKSNADALWARIQEENVKQDRPVREHIQQLTNMVNNCLNKDLPVIIEKTVKRELAAVGHSVARTITPTIEKIVSTSIAERFQKGVGDKAVNQLEKSVNSKLEATVARQIQVQFQTSGKQALQETLKSCLEVSVIPAFEMSCRASFEQIDAAFMKGMVEHSAAAQQQFDTSHSALAIALRDAINSSSSITQTLSSEILDGQRKLLSLAAHTQAANPLICQLSNGPLGGLQEKLEAPPDPTAEICRLISERKYEEAFTATLQRTDVNIVSWLCAQVDLPGILSLSPVPLSQGVLLSLLQQLACDIMKDTSRKLTWMREILSAMNPADAIIVVHLRPVFEQVYQILNHHRNLPTCSGAELSNIRLIIHVINSMLMTSK